MSGRGVDRSIGAASRAEGRDKGPYRAFPGLRIETWGTLFVLLDEFLGSEAWRLAPLKAMKMLFGAGMVSWFPRSQNRDLGHPVRAAR